MADSLSSLLENQRRNWAEGRRLPVEDYARVFPRVASDPDHLLDLIYNEIFLREQRGDKPSLDEYVRRFPTLADDLRMQFEVHEEIGDEAEWRPSTRPGARPTTRWSPSRRCTPSFSRTPPS